MNKQFSIYLDLLRFIAATFVFISHAPGFSGGWLWQLAGLGHEAVVVFFVLSGFVISYVVYEKKEDARTYSLNRLSRIYSVAFPALLLSLFLFYLGQEINEQAFSTLNDKLQTPVWTFFSSLFFLNQSWVASPSFSNLPYWSLGYEVIYYIFFGLLIFMKGSAKWLSLIFITILMGPSIMLYLPVWFAGVVCYKYLRKYMPSLKLALLLFIFSIIAIGIHSTDTVQLALNDFMRDIIGDKFYSVLLEPAEYFFSDYILTIFVTLHIYSAFHLFKQYMLFNQYFAVMIKRYASHTFSLYLFHMPIFYFISAVFPYQAHPQINLISIWLFTPLIIFIISNFIENNRSQYKKFFGYIIKETKQASVA